MYCQVLILARPSDLDGEISTIERENTHIAKRKYTICYSALSEMNDFEHHVTVGSHVNSSRFNRVSDERSIEVTFHYAQFVLQQDI